MGKNIYKGFRAEPIKPVCYTLGVVYHFTNIGRTTVARRHYLVDVFLLDDDRKIVDDPTKASGVAGVIRVLTRAPLKERVDVDVLTPEILGRKPRISLLLQFGLQEYDVVSRVDYVLARMLAGVCALRGLFGCTVRGRRIVWGGRELV